MRKTRTNYRLWAIVALLSIAGWMVWDTVLDEEPEYNVFNCVLKFGAAVRQGRGDAAFRSAVAVVLPVLVYTLFGVGLGWCVQRGIGRFRPNEAPAVDPQRADFGDQPPMPG